MQSDGRDDNTGSRMIRESKPYLHHTRSNNKEVPKISAKHLSPLRLLVIIIAGIFLAEIIAMMVVYALGPLPYIQLTLIDAGVMTALITPLLFLLSFRPLLLYIQKSREAEANLIRSLDLQERFFDSIDTLIAYMDRDFNFIRVNEAYARSDRRQPDYFVGRNHFELYPHRENQAIFQQVVDTAEGYSVYEKPFEYPEQPERGITYWNWSLLPVRGQDGQVEGLVLSLVDVTERVRAEAKNRQLSRIVEQTADTVVVTDCDGMIEYVNPAFEQRTGYTLQEVFDRKPNILKSGLHDDSFYRELWGTILSGDVFQSEIANRKKDGALFYEVKTITPLRDDHGDITHFVATGKDITAHKQAEEKLRQAYEELEVRVEERTEELRIANSILEEEIVERKRVEEAIKESEEKYRSLFRNMSEGFALHEIILDADGNPCDYRFLELNDAFENLTGLSRNNLLGRTVKEVIPDIEPGWIETYGRVALTGSPAHYMNQNASLNKWYETYCYSPKQDLFAVLFFDITERKQIEDALRESEKRLNRAQEIAHLGSWELDVINDRLSWSDEVYRIFGLQPQEFRANYEAFLEYVHPEDRALVDAAYSGSIREGWDSYEIDHRVIKRSTGEVRVVHEKCEHFRDDSGRIVRSAGMVHDITERKQAEEALRAARDELELRVRERTKELLDEIAEREQVERQLRIRTTAMEAAANGIVIADSHGNILWINPALSQMSGYSAEELISQNIRLFRSGHQDREFYNEMWTTILAGRVWHGETTNRRKDGSLYIEEQTITPVKGEDGQISHFIAIKQDISEHKRIEAELEAERTRLKNILDTIPDGVYIVNQAYEIEYTNPVIGREFGPVNQRACFTYFHDLEEPCSWCKNDKVFAGVPIAGEHYYAKNNKSYEIFDAPLVNSNGSLSKLKLLHDITQRKKMEVDLAQSNQELLTASSAERKQRQLAEALVEAALALNKSLNLDEVLAIILEQIRQVIPYQFANIGLLEGEVFYDASHRGDAELPATQMAVMRRFLLDDFPLLKDMCQSGKPILIPDSKSEPNWKVVDDLEWCRSFLSAPLVVEKQVIGFVNLFAREVTFYTEEMRDRLGAFASHAAAAIQNAWLFEQVRASSERLQSLSRRLVEVQEAERLYIARELHDEAGQMLTSLMLDLRMLEKKASQPDVLLRKITEMEGSLNNVIENLHNVAMALRPASLDHLGLVSALRQHVGSVGEKHGLQAHFRSKGVLKRLQPNVETVLYRIVQEALTNVVRHAQATQVDVVLTVRGDKLLVIIEDDGSGFHPEDIPPEGHLGLFGMRERVEMIDGKLVIESTPGEGTTIIVEVDYEDSNIDRG